MIPQETVNRILDTAQIAGVVGDFVTLKRRGAHFTACCPFHNEKTPSFYVSPAKGIFKCFGCGKSGTAVGFVMEHESLSYVEALKYLAKKYNIEVVEKEESVEDIAKRQKNESLLLVSEYASKFFQSSLDTPDGRAIGYAYFKKRGLSDETIRKFGLGWAPAARKALSDSARESGYKEEYLVETGLSIKREDGGLNDRFFDRVIFPIHSVAGRVIAFGGRTLKTDKSVAKYVNSPETEIYVKSRSLYGIYFAKNEISRQNRCILVEGYLDVLSMHQLDITNVVASSGTSLTVEQIRLIRKFTDNVTIIYDGDGAGVKAALRGIDLVLKEGLNVKIVLLPDGQDPDDFARTHTKDEVLEYIAENEKDFISFKTDMLLGEAGNDPIRRAGLINDVADSIAQIPDAVIRAVYVRASAERFEMDEQLLLDRINRTRKEMIVSEQKQIEREMVRSQSVVQNDDRQPDVESFENPHLAPCEKELLKYLLEEGCSELEFDRDSKYYVEGEPVNVAEFIDAALAEDEADFVNVRYRNVYDEYFRLYDEGLTQQQIQSRLLNHKDDSVASVAKELLIEKYQITVSNYEKSLTATSTRLVMYVPKSLMSYQCRKIEAVLQDLMNDLAKEEDPERQGEILKRIGEFNKARTRLNNELGKV